MITRDALNILNPEAFTHEAVMLAYRRAAMKYHPDRGGSLQMMQAVNEALETLQAALDQGQTFEPNETQSDYGDELNAAIRAIIDLPGIVIEICGSWVWVSGDTRPHKDVIKAAGFKWAPKKAMWHFRPAEYKSHFSRGRMDMDDIRNKYGSSRPGFAPSNRIARGF